MSAHRLKERNSSKVVLYFPRPFSDTRPWHGTPLALLAVSGLLVSEGFDVHIIADFLFKDHIAEIVRQCQDSICLGLTCMTGFQIYDALRIADAVRISRPDLLIVWGGWHPSILPEETMRDSRVDIVVRGQGERKFAEVVHRLREHASLDGIAGVTYKLRDGSVVSTPDCALEDINRFPPYPYHLIDIERCLGTTEYGRRTIHYISSQGCPNRCGFCVEPTVNRRRWSGLSAERVVSEWEYLYKHYRIDSVAVYDSNFFVDKDRVYQICMGLLKKNVKIKWGSANGHIRQLIKYEPEIWEAMKYSGCKMVLTGAESGSRKVLDLIRKDINIDQIKSLTQLCHKHHIRILFSYLMGFPWSKSEIENQRHFEEEFSLTLRQIADLMDIDSNNRFMIYIYAPYPGSHLYSQALKYGFQAPRTLAEWGEYSELTPEDVFDINRRKKFVSRSQDLRVAMINQYVFGMMDLHARRYISAKMRNPISRTLFLLSWNVGLLMARLRWRFNFWALPFDFWIFTQVRKYLKLI